MRSLSNKFSWTQFELWHKSKKSYYKKYGLGEDEFDSGYLDKGRKFMVALEYGVFDDPDPLLPEIIKDIDKHEIFEERIEVLLPEDYGITIPIVSYVDTSNQDLTSIGEYKTGKHFWDGKRVAESDQLVFYATACFLKTGTVPSTFLTWVQTEESDSGELYYTGHWETFDRKIKKTQVNSMIKRIAKTIKEIGDYQHHELEVSNDKVKELIDMYDKRNALDMGIGKLENDIQNELEHNNLKYAYSDFGTFTLGERKQYEYSDEVQKLEDALKDLKKEERDEGIVKVTINPTSIKFNKAKDGIN